MYGHPFAQDYRFIQLAERRRRRRERLSLLLVGLPAGVALVALADFFVRLIPF